VSVAALTPAPRGMLAIPAKLGGKPVTGIGAGAFNGFADLTAVRIPAGVEHFDAGAFDGCDNLATIQVDRANKHYSVVNGLLIYDRQARALKQLRKGGLTNVSASQKNLNKAIQDCPCDIYLAKVPPAAKTVTIPQNVTMILPKAFAGCRNLTKVTLPAGLKRIGYAAFSDCGKLEEIKIPKSVEELVWDECDGMYGLMYQENNDFGLRLLRGLFHGCDSLKSVKLERNCQDYWMENGLLLAKGGRAWRNGQDRVALVKCLASGDIRIPASVKIISDGAFAGCAGINSIEVEKGNTEYSSANGALLSTTGTALLKLEEGKVILPK